jgi:hypothetical protein
MASTKVTFTLDPATIQRLEQTATRLAKPKSEVVREAIHDFHQRTGKLSEQERVRLLAVAHEMMARPVTRDSRSVDREIRAIRAARRTGGRRSESER